MGSPHFAVPSLSSLLESSHEIVGVITQPDRPAGRGMKLKSPPVKETALKSNVPVFQPEKLNTDAVYEWLDQMKPELIVVVAYGEFLGKRILEFCDTPPINVHPSLLPKLRGAAPIQWTLLNGDTVGGVTVQYMAKKMDAGDILNQVEEIISPDINGEELHNHFAQVGAKLLVKTVDQISAKSETATPQKDEEATFAPLLKKEDGKIDWNNDSQKIHNQIRGLFPWPSAFTNLGDLSVKIRRSKLVSESDAPPQSMKPGEFFPHNDSILVKTGTGWLEVLELQPAGKRPLLPAEFANGIKGQTEKGRNLQFN